MPVSPGAASPNDLGRDTPAVVALSSALHREKLTYLALGPLTNLATFLKLHPAQAGRIARVIMVVGKTPEATLGFGPQNRFRVHDANLVKDRAAVREVLRSGIPLVLAPIEISSHLLLDGADLRALERSGPAGRYLARHSGTWLWFWTRVAHTRGGPIFDALAVIAAAQPSLLTVETRRATFDQDGQLIVRRNSGRELRFCAGFAPITKDWVLRRLTGPPTKSSTGPPIR